MYYSLAHDLVEIYAGDVLCFDNVARIGKEERERSALDRIRQEINFPALIKYIEQYELKQDPESQFIYALDKIIAPLNIINND
jgi:5'-deoxynucleotidase YfbR-like HD superfamily hydrolase